MIKVRHRHRHGDTPTLLARGFTLVELMIAVVLVALLAAVSAPSISASVERNNINQLNRDIVATFNQARTHAMRNGQAVYIEVDNNEVVFYEARAGGSDWEAPTCSLAPDVDPHEDTIVGAIRPDGRGLDMVIETPEDQSSGQVERLCISPRGTVTDEDGVPIQAAATGCGEMNVMIPVLDEESSPSGNLKNCEDSPQIRADRELAKFSMIHISYGGQARVMR